jgi:hypothetical protein
LLIYVQGFDQIFRLVSNGVKHGGHLIGLTLLTESRDNSVAFEPLEPAAPIALKLIREGDIGIHDPLPPS